MKRSSYAKLAKYAAQLIRSSGLRDNECEAGRMRGWARTEAFGKTHVEFLSTDVSKRRFRKCSA